VLALHLLGGFKFDPPGSTRRWWCLLSECGVVGAQARSALVSSVALHSLGVGGEAALSVGRTGGGSSGLSDRGVTAGETCWLTPRGSVWFMLRLIVKSCVAGESADGWSGVGAAVVEGASVGIDSVAIATGAGVEGAGSVSDGGAGVDDAAALLLELFLLLLLLLWLSAMLALLVQALTELALFVELLLLLLLLLLSASASALMVRALLVMLVALMLLVSAMSVL